MALDTSWSFTIESSLDESWSFTVEVIDESTAPSVGLYFNITDIYTSVPTDDIRLRNVWNQFDEHGIVIGLKRIPGEKNAAFKRRILDVFVNQSNSSYKGLINGVTRELGLSLFQPIQIRPRINNNRTFLAVDPYVLFDGVWLYLYHNYAEGLYEWKIDRQQVGGNYETLGRLVDFINTTTFFEASLLDADYSQTRSMTILNQSNRKQVIDEGVPQSTKFKLDFPYLVDYSVTASDRSVLRTLVDTVGEVTAKGKYHIDIPTGITTLYSIPTTGVSLNYQYTEYNFKPIASPVILHDLNNDNFKVKMFEQLFDNNFQEYKDGLPTELGVDLINELLSIHPMYWGV